MPGDIEIRTLLVGSRTHVFVLEGELDSRTAAQVDSELRQADGETMIVDLLDVTFIDAAGLAVLDRPGLSVVADRPALHKVTRCGDPDMLTCYSTLSAAVADVATV